MVLEADSWCEERTESLNSGSSSEECVANTIIPPQSRPEATLMLAGKFAYEMLHEQWYSRVCKGAQSSEREIDRFK